MLLLGVEDSGKEESMVRKICAAYDSLQMLGFSRVEATSILRIVFES